MRLRAKILATGKTAAGIVLPDDFVAALGPSRHPRVRVSLNGHTFRSSIGVMRGTFMLPMTAATRTQTGVAAGEEVELDIELDLEPRVVEVPTDLTAALAADETARSAFEALSYSNQRRLVIPIESAKAEETRRRRVEKTLAGLHDGRT